MSANRRQSIILPGEELLPSSTASPASPAPVLVSLAATGGSGGRIIPPGVITRQDLDAIPNGAFRCTRGEKVTYALKVNGMLIPTTATNAAAVARLAGLLALEAGHEKPGAASWCKAYTVVKNIANAAVKEGPQQ